MKVFKSYKVDDTPFFCKYFLKENNLTSSIAKAKKRIENKEKNRNAILAAAKEVFSQIGIEACNIRDIIRKTNLASGTFYNYFKTKEEVFIAIHDDALTRFKPYLKNAFIESNGDFGKFIETAFLAYFEFKRQNGIINPNNSKSISSNFKHNTPESTAIFNEIKNYINEFCNDQKLCSINSELLTASCIGMAQELGDCIIFDERFSPQDAAKFATKLILNGVKGLLN